MTDHHEEPRATPARAKVGFGGNEHDTWPDAGPRPLRRHLPQMVGEVMSPATCVRSNVSLTEATRILSDSGPRVVVVVDDTGRPLGVMTSDKLVEVVGQHHRKSLAELRPLDASLQHTVVMPDTTRIDMAAHVLARAQRDFALVTSPAGRVEGMIFAGDLLRALGW